MTMIARWLMPALLALVPLAVSAATQPEPRCRKGDAAALADYRKVIGAEEKRLTPAQEGELVQRLQRGVDNECTEAARELAYIRMMQWAGTARRANEQHRQWMATELHDLLAETGRVDGWWAGLGDFYLAREFGHFDPQAAIKAFEAGAARNDRDSIHRLADLYARGGDGIAPDPEKAALWRAKLEAFRE